MQYLSSRLIALIFLALSSPLLAQPPAGQFVGGPPYTERGHIHFTLRCGNSFTWNSIGGPYSFDVRESNYDPDHRCSVTVTSNGTVDAPNHRDAGRVYRTIHVAGATTATISCNGANHPGCGIDIFPIGTANFHVNGGHAWDKVLQCGNSIVWGTSPRIHSTGYGAWDKRWHDAVKAARQADGHHHTIYDQNSGRGIYTVISKRGGCALTVTVPTPGQAPVVVAPGSAFTFDTQSMDYFTITCASAANGNKCEFIVLARFAQ